jgi:hypothetical protein
MENNNTVQNVVHGFKVFRPDWTCSPNGNTKQYTCPGKFEEEGELDVCGHGMHFCQTVERKSSKAIPNFDAEILFQCTGVRVDE